MNIQGIRLLKEKKLPEGLFIFRELSEITEDFLKDFGDEKELFFIGVDNRDTITTNPYQVCRCRVLNFSKFEIKDSFNKIGLEMDKEGIPAEHRIFITGRMFTEENVIIQGHVYRNEDFVLIEFIEGMRPHRKELKPEFSFKIPIINGRCSFGSLVGENHGELIRQLCQHSLCFYEGNPYLDFVVMSDGKLLYHDLSFH